MKARMAAEAKVDSVESASSVSTFYSCGGVFQWVDPLMSPTPGVAISSHNVKLLAERYYKDGPPDVCKQAVVVAVTQKSFDPMEHQGSLIAVSPIEFLHAALFACHRDIANKATDTCLRTWRTFFLTLQIDFVRIPESMVPLMSFHLREEMLDNGEAVAWTTLQKIQMVVRMKNGLEQKGGKVTASRVAQLFERVKLARTSEAMSAGFIDAAMTVDARMLSIPSCSARLESLDDQFGVRGPFDSVYKLQSLVTKANLRSRRVTVDLVSVSGWGVREG